MYDTSYVTDTIIDLRLKNDTQYVKVPKVITRTITIRDTIKSVVVDGARVLLLQKEVDKLKAESQGWKALAKDRWWYLFWIILFTILYLLRKPIMKLCLPMLR